MRLKTLFLTLVVPTATIILAVLSSCAKEEVFPALGAKVVSPTDVAVSKDLDTFYVLNSDMIRIYNKGSILILDTDGNKIKAIETPRLGRNMVVSGDVMIIGYSDAGEEGDKPTLEIYDISSPREPVLMKSIPLESDPLNTVVREDYNYFAVSCQGGMIYVGELDRNNLANTVVHKVRELGNSKRAMHIDVNNEVLYAFSTDTGLLNQSDSVYVDKYSYDEDYKQTEGGNEVPDAFEANRKDQQLNEGIKRSYQFLVYDLKDGKSKGFPFENLATMDKDKELKWMYFDIPTPAGQEAKEKTAEELTKQYYRTNFYLAKQDPDDPNSFYMSHRGRGSDSDSPHSNQIIRVTITANPFQLTEPKTTDFLSIETTYSVQENLEEKDYAYVSDFEIATFNSQKVILMNSFRDLVNFKNDDQHVFSITAKQIGSDGPAVRLSTQALSNSYLQVAAGKDGKVLTGSFYTDLVVLLTVDPSKSIEETKRID